MLSTLQFFFLSSVNSFHLEQYITMFRLWQDSDQTSNIIIHKNYKRYGINIRNLATIYSVIWNRKWIKSKNCLESSKMFNEMLVNRRASRKREQSIYNSEKGNPSFTPPHTWIGRISRRIPLLLTLKSQVWMESCRGAARLCDLFTQHLQYRLLLLLLLLCLVN